MCNFHVSWWHVKLQIKSETFGTSSVSLPPASHFPLSVEPKATSSWGTLVLPGECTGSCGVSLVVLGGAFLGLQPCSPGFGNAVLWTQIKKELLCV